MTKGNLLIVDDEPLLLKRLRMNLEEYVDRVFTAADGVEALAILRTEEIRCVICDVNMPRMNGIEVIKKIRAEKNDVPFIFYTGHGNQDMMMEVAKYGAYDFFNKPQFDGLEEVISRGFKNGFHVKPLDQISDLISDYQKLLGDLGED
jgi:DNA-binding NtrC family response regulator